MALHFIQLANVFIQKQGFPHTHTHQVQFGIQCLTQGHFSKKSKGTKSS